MDVQKVSNDNIQSLNDVIEALERESFIGRKKEMGVFKDFISSTDRYVKLLHLYGMGGIGKTYLLGEFSRFAEEKGSLFLMMDSGDYSHTPRGFSKHLLTLFSKVLNDPGLTSTPSNQKVYQYCLDTLERISKKQQVIIAIDTYNSIDNLDRWYRQAFVRNLPPNVYIVLAGRESLKGEWIQSPAWRKVTKQMKLGNFNFSQSTSFLKNTGIENEKNIKELWRFTEGHPLTLSLASLTNQELDLSYAQGISESVPHILMKLTKIWLEEIVDIELLEIIELAALFHTFDQSSLNAILHEEVTIDKFSELVSLSFIKRLNNGWAMHDLIRDAVKIELQHRNPDYYKSLNERMIAYYYKKVIASRSAHDISQFFYHVGDDAIRSAFFLETFDTSMYLEPVEAYNFSDVISYFKDKREHIIESNAKFFDRATAKTVTLHTSKKHNEREVELIDEKYIEKMGYDSIQLLKNKKEETLGVSIIIPVNQKTLKHLIKEPVSRTYFSKLNESELDYYDVPEQESTGLFIRMLDFNELADTAARSFLLYNLFSLLLSGGRIIVSTPLSFYQDLLQKFGFTMVPGATHNDYEEDVLTPTYLLDVSGSNLADYLQNFMESLSQSNQMNFLSEKFAFTDREKDIVMLILDNKSNIEIAEKLFLAEVTVKKHVTRILKKVNVTNRAQLIKCMMELI